MTVLLQELLRALLRGNAPQPRDLLVADLHDVRLAQAPLHGGFGALLPLPQRLAEVEVQADRQSDEGGSVGKMPGKHHAHTGPGGRFRAMAPVRPVRRA